MPDKKLKILADENMPALSACFASVAEIKTKAGRDIKAEDLIAVDALLVRSITKVNETLLSQSDLNFIGSATIGTDHIDQSCLTEKGIHFSHAPGSNAQSVVEYVITAIALWCQQQQKDIRSLQIGVIGKGQIGSRLVDFLNALGVQVVCCDPPLQQSGEQGPWVDLKQIQSCDVITCHVPLTTSGSYKTQHLIDEEFMSEMKSGALLINSSRGAVVDNKALLSFLDAGRFDAVLDVWETEPEIDLALMDAVFLATPHIAGYALEAKIRGTFMLYQAFCRCYNIKETVTFNELLPNPPDMIQFKNAADWIKNATQFYDIQKDDTRMRKAIKENPNAFDALRKNYPKRREFLKL